MFGDLASCLQVNNHITDKYTSNVNKNYRNSNIGSLFFPIEAIRFLLLHSNTAFPTSNLDHPAWKTLIQSVVESMHFETEEGYEIICVGKVCGSLMELVHYRIWC